MAARSSRLVEPEVEALVDEVWAGQVARGVRLGHPLIDAPAYRLERATVVGGDLELGLALEPYRIHSAMKELHDHPRVRPEHHDRMLVADALVTTADDRVLLLDTPKVTGRERQLVGATASPGRRRIDSGTDLAAFTRDRVRHALDLPGELEVRGLRGLVEHPVGCVHAVIDVRLAVPAARVAAAGGRRLVVVERPALGDFLRGAPGYLPAVADLL